jgi:ubiquinone/menaquinone biosynthesis C-methylase UbiE
MAFAGAPCLHPNEVTDDMIIYKNPAVAELAQGYNATYGREADHFSHKATFAALEHFIKVLGIRPQSCLDIGCGQGQVVAKVYDILREEGRELDGQNFIGLDISDVAIDQCETRYPHISWIADSYQNAVDKKEFKRLTSSGIDLIVNKSGFTAVRSEKEYARGLQRAKDSLSQSGHFLFIMARRFYNSWSKLRAHGWKRDPLQVVFDTFGEPAVLPNTSYYFYLFAKNPKTTNSHPRNVIFTFDDGSTATNDIYFDLETRVRVGASCVDKPRTRAVMPDMRLSNAPNIAFPLARKLQESGESLHMIEGVISSSAVLARHIHETCAMAADAIAVGGSLRDWLVHNVTGQPVVDLDEFYNTMDWIFFILRNSEKGKITYLTAFPRVEGTDSNGYIHSPETARPYREALHDLTRDYDIRLVDITDVTADRYPNAAFYMAALAAGKDALR